MSSRRNDSIRPLICRGVSHRVGTVLEPVEGDDLHDPLSELSRVPSRMRFHADREGATLEFEVPRLREGGLPTNPRSSCNHASTHSPSGSPRLPQMAPPSPTT